jgi:chorismate dehydratase
MKQTPVNNKDEYKQLLKIPIKKAIKLGKYSFCNCLPINLPMEHFQDTLIQGYTGTPEAINSLLIEGKIHAGPVSSYEYLKHKEQLLLMNDISISSQKEVGSVILFSKYSFEELGKKTIAVAYTSSTSVKLLQLLLITLAKARANFVVHYYDHSVEEYLKTYDAVLYIGDPALQSAYNLRENEIIKQYDLAGLWVSLYNLPAVFGVWVATRRWADQNPELFYFLNQSLNNAKEKGLTVDFDKVVSQAIDQLKLPEAFIVQYFKERLSYNLTDIHQQSLELYYCQLKQNGLI